MLRDGAEVLEPVKWVGQSHVDLPNYPCPEDAAPIRFRKDSIADNQPHSDLLVSPEHSMIIDGLCVPAKYLVNGATIVSEREHGPFTYHHLELEQHGILFAEGALAESYLDTGNRSWFDNGDGVTDLFPSFTVNGGATRWQTDACAPLARVPEDVAPIWQRLADRAIALGYRLPDPVLLRDADLRLLADGREIRAVSSKDSRALFIVPAGVASVQLVSRFCIPSDRMIAAVRDTRRLGVRVESIIVRTGEDETVIHASHPALSEGWHDLERDGNVMWRWTDGAAIIPWTVTSEPVILTIQCTPAEGYPAQAAQDRRAA